VNAGDSAGRGPVGSSGVGPPVSGAPDPDDGNHLGDLVVDLTSGDLGGADPSAVLAHLDRCPRCRSELTDAVVVAAALRAEQPAPGPSADTTAATLPPLAFDPAVGPGPDRSRGALHPAAATPTAHLGSGRRARGPRPLAPAGHRRRALALTAAAALAAGVLVGGGLASTRRPAGTPPAAVTVLLRSGAVTRGAAVVTAAGGQREMTVTAAVTPGAAGHPGRVVLTVWLTRPDGRTAQRVGVLDGQGRGSFSMSAGTAARYPRVVLTASAAPVAALDPAAVVATAQLS